MKNADSQGLLPHDSTTSGADIRLLLNFTTYLEVAFRLAPSKAIEVAEHFTQFMKEVGFIANIMESIHDPNLATTLDKDPQLVTRIRASKAFMVAEKTHSTRRRKAGS